MADAVRPKGRPHTRARLGGRALGVATTGARYLTQRVPLYRRDREDDDGDDPMPDLARGLPGDPDSLQRASDGYGDLFHRRYWIHVTDEELSAEELIDRIVADPNAVSPTAMAQFLTRDGDPATDLEVGDELVVRLPGPWNGPIRVIDRSPTSFRVATLRGHMEAGEIEFSTGYDARGFLYFRIDSWARSGDRLFLWLYERFPVGREVQLLMWSQFCQKVAATAGGVQMSNVACMTRRLE